MSNVRDIEKEARAFFQKIGTEGEVKAREEGEGEEKSIVIEATFEEPQLFIGERGQTLSEIQHLLRLVLRKKIPDEKSHISLDINQYKKSKETYLQEMALSAADEVSLLKKPKELPPMPSSERRVIHMALAERSDVTSESEGEGLGRKIVVRPT